MFTGNQMCDNTQAVAALSLAQQLYRDYYAMCFWHCKPDLAITEDKIPFIIRELRKHGGRQGMLAAGQLRRLIQCHLPHFRPALNKR